MKRKTKITMTAIAKQAHTSVASVSRVIHTPHLTSKAIQVKVHQAIEKLDFDAKCLLKPREPTVTSKKILVIDNQFSGRSLINQGIEITAKIKGYKLLYLRFLYFTKQEIQQIISYTINHSLDGIIIINNSPYLSELLQYKHALPPLVLVNQFMLDLPCVYFDHIAIGYKATRYLVEQGHKRIAILLGQPDKLSTQQVKNGYLQALQRAELSFVEHYLVMNCCSYSAYNYAVKALMSQAMPPTAIICSDNLCLDYMDYDELSEKQCQEPRTEYLSQHTSEDNGICSVLEQCQAMGIKIPSQLSLLYFSHSSQRKPYGDLNHVSSLYKPLYKMGESAVELLLTRLAPSYQSAYTNLARLIETELITRHSVADLKSE